METDVHKSGTLVALISKTSRKRISILTKRRMFRNLCTKLFPPTARSAIIMSPSVHAWPSGRLHFIRERPDLSHSRKRRKKREKKRERTSSGGNENSPDPRAKEAAGAVLSEALIIEVSKWRDSDVLPYKWHHISGQVSPVCRVAPAWCMDDGILAGPTHPPRHPYRLLDSYTIVFPIVGNRLSNLRPVAQPRALPPCLRYIARPPRLRTSFSRYYVRVVHWLEHDEVWQFQMGYLGDRGCPTNDDWFWKLC